MKAVLLMAVPLALLPGGATRPSLRYDLAGLAAAGRDCAMVAGRCDLAIIGGRTTAGIAAARVVAGVDPRDLPPLPPPEPDAPLLPVVLAGPAIGSGVRLVVSLPEQRLYLFRDGALLATSPVSTGRAGHTTPAGLFPILQKQVHHRSNQYSNAPMPYMQRLTYGGIALHAGHLPGYPASHGCIRLPWTFAKMLYGVTDYATLVTVTRARPDGDEDALALAARIWPVPPEDWVAAPAPQYAFNGSG